MDLVVKAQGWWTSIHCTMLRNSIVRALLDAKERRESRKIMDAWFEHVEECDGCSDEKVA